MHQMLVRRWLLFDQAWPQLGRGEERECCLFPKQKLEREREREMCLSSWGPFAWLWIFWRPHVRPLSHRLRLYSLKLAFPMLHMVRMHTRHIDPILWSVAHGHAPCFLMCNPCTYVTHLCVQSMGIQERYMPSIFIRGPSHAPTPPSRSTTIQFFFPMSLLPK